MRTPVIQLSARDIMFFSNLQNLARQGFHSKGFNQQVTKEIGRKIIIHDS